MKASFLLRPLYSLKNAPVPIGQEPENGTKVIYLHHNKSIYSLIWLAAKLMES
jgi:hypothetical protein